MTPSELQTVVFEGLRQVAPEADLSALDARANIREALDIDSFDFLNFLVGLHGTLGIEIPEADYGRLGTLDQMLAYLSARVH